jgi:DNA (cytosine-5)-methyltransferase 1
MKDAVIVEDDIRRLSSEMLLSLAESAAGEIFLVAGGPPCQPFSRAGKRQSVEAEDGRLFLEFVRVVEDVRPRWFLFENVKGLILTKTDVVSGSCKHCYLNWTVSFEERLSHLGGLPLSSSCPKCQSVEVEMTTNRVAGGTLDIILGEFEALGYECHSTILNAADFGTPQLRERLIIVGSRDHERFQWPYPTHQNARARKAPTLFESAITPEWRGIGDALWSNGHPAYGQLDRDKAVLWVKNVVRPHDEPVTWPLNRPSPTIGAHQAAKLALAPFGVPAEQLARQQWHTLGRRQRDLPKVFVEHRYLSDDELLKLQTFPESWYLFGTRMQRAAQIGNAVPVVLAAALGGAILAACSTDSFQRDHSVPPIGKTDEHLASVHG